MEVQDRQNNMNSLLSCMVRAIDKDHDMLLKVCLSSFLRNSIGIWHFGIFLAEHYYSYFTSGH